MRLCYNFTVDEMGQQQNGPRVVAALRGPVEFLLSICRALEAKGHAILSCWTWEVQFHWPVLQ
jgi:hypothetical protein